MIFSKSDSDANLAKNDFRWFIIIWLAASK